MCVFSSHPFWTSGSLDVPAGVTQEEGHTGFLIHLPSAVRALIFVARRIQPFLSLVDREVVQKLKKKKKKDTSLLYIARSCTTSVSENSVLIWVKDGPKASSCRPFICPYCLKKNQNALLLSFRTLNSNHIHIRYLVPCTSAGSRKLHGDFFLSDRKKHNRVTPLFCRHSNLGSSSLSIHFKRTDCCNWSDVRYCCSTILSYTTVSHFILRGGRANFCPTMESNPYVVHVLHA